MVAITVYFLLCIAFYAFFSPFLGKDLYEYIAVGIYSFLVRFHPTMLGFNTLVSDHCFDICFLFCQALSVLILYVRCTAIDPADPGILISMDGTLFYKSEGISCSLTMLL